MKRSASRVSWRLEVIEAIERTVKAIVVTLLSLFSLGIIYYCCFLELVDWITIGFVCIIKCLTSCCLFLMFKWVELKISANSLIAPFTCCYLILLDLSGIIERGHSVLNMQVELSSFIKSSEWERWSELFWDMN